MNDRDAIKWIDLAVPMLRHDVETAILSHEVMEAQNAIIPAGLKGRHTEYLNTYGAIQNALVLKLAMDVARVFDFGVGRPVDRQDMASIPALAMLFKVAGVREQLKARASKWVSGIEWADGEDAERSPELEAVALEILQDEQSLDEKACDNAIDHFLVIADNLFVESRPEAAALQRVKAFRNRRLAHALFNKEPDPYPSYADLTLLLEIAKSAATLSSLAVEGLETEFTDQTDRNRQNAEGFAKLVLSALKGVSEHG